MNPTPPPDLHRIEAILRDRLAVDPAEPPEILLVLGSGLGGLADRVEDARSAGLSDLPGFPETGVSGHRGQILLGTLEGRRVLVQAGRYHLYEGHDPALVVAPLRLAARLGVRGLFVTNAAGGIGAGMGPGDLMLIRDHLNLQGRNPLVGPVEEGESRFPDLTAAYDPALRALALEEARSLGLALHQGVYAAVLGPSFETPAEIEMLSRLGADAVGMSTVPEVIVARNLGLRVLGISLISNLAAGRSPEPLSHREVMEAGREAAGRLEALARGILRRWPAGGTPEAPGPQASGTGAK